MIHFLLSRRSGTQRMVCAWLAAMGTASFAAGSADLSNAREPVAPPLLPAVPAAGFTLPPVAAPEAARSGVAGAVRVTPQAILFRGNTVVSTQALERLAEPYLKRGLTDADLESLRLLVTRFYVEQGFVNSGAVLSADAVAGSRLTLDLVEGRLSYIRLRGLEHLNESYVVKRLVPDENAVFNADALRERYQLLLEDPLFERLNARVIPDQRPGEAVLDIEATRAPAFHATLSVNNYRPVSIGETGYTLAMGVRNLSGYGDLLDASLQAGADNMGDGRYTLSWRIPLNAHGTGFSYQLEHGESSVLEQPLKTLGIGSTIDARDIGLSQVVQESLRHKLTLGVNQVERENRTTLLGQPFSFTVGELDGVTKVSTSRLWGEYSARDERHVMVARLTTSQSSNNLQDVTGLPGSTPQASHSYRTWLAQFQYAREVMESGAQLAVRATAQSAEQSLVALDRMAIGGVSTVRGYRENYLIRDTGRVVNLEFHYPVRLDGVRDAKLDVAPFYDHGEGQNVGEGVDALSSAGVAVHFATHGFSVDVALAQRLQHPDPQPDSGALQDKSIHLQVSYAF